MRYVSKRALTPREDEVVSLIADGYRDKEIADRLEISVRTVQTHTARAFLKARVRTRRDLAVWWVKQLPEPEEAVS